MNEANEVIREVANARREARHYLMQLIHYLRTIRHGISRRNHMYTKQDVLREAQKKFDKFMKNMNYYETHKREAKRDTYQNNPSETENHNSDKAYRIEMIEVKAEEANEIFSEVNDKEIKCYYSKGVNVIPYIINIISIMLVGISTALILRGNNLFNSAGQRLIKLNNVLCTVNYSDFYKSE